MSTKRITAVKGSLIILIFSSIFSMPQIYADLSVGDSYNGGTVFCVSQTPDITKCVTQGSGKYGLIMANKDQVNFDSNAEHGVTWSSERKETKAISDDDGAANTAAIIAAHPKDNPSNNAAWLCSNYRGGGKEGWYLPSKDELNKMYLFAKAHNLIGKGCSGSRAGGVRCLIGGYDNDMEYWSSTEYSCGHYAWVQVFSGGVQGGGSKDRNYFGVRAVRAFINLSIQPFNNLPKPKSPQPVGVKIPVVPQKAVVSAAAGAAAAVQNPVQVPAVPVLAPVTPAVVPVAPASTAHATVPAAAAAAAAPSHTDTDRFTFGDVGERLARLGDLNRLYPPDYRQPTLTQALTEADVPTPGEVVAHCNDVAACAVAEGVVNCTRLTREDAAAIAMYTYDFGGAEADNNPYRLINQGLFERNAPQLRKLRGLIYNLLHALRKVQPARPQALFRGIKDRVKLNDTHYHEGNKITWHSFSSTTTKMGVTQNFLTDANTGKCEGTLFIITGTPWGYNIQPFSCFPDEEEILLEPEVELRVTGVVNPPVGLTVVNLEMLPDQRLLLESLIPRNVGVVVGLASSPALMAAAQVQYKRYTALADWESAIEGGLSFRQGDIINIIDDKHEWWMGELNGERGWVPPAYLRANFPSPAPQKY